MGVDAMECLHGDGWLQACVDGIEGEHADARDVHMHAWSRCVFLKWVHGLIDVHIRPGRNQSKRLGHAANRSVLQHAAKGLIAAGCCMMPAAWIQEPHGAILTCTVALQVTTRSAALHQCLDMSKPSRSMLRKTFP